ncbi:MAG: DUF4398 domain-containing protein [Deltaproteobacteria bacterium]|nr:DUF4398 domain-containing protein [Deltaproteobacteria bacterium]
MGTLSRLAALAAAVLVANALPACVTASSTAAVAEADEALVAARDVGAEARAPYLWWSARAYLDEARALHGRAEYGSATRFARRAARYAEDARAAALALGPLAEPATAPASQAEPRP